MKTKKKQRKNIHVRKTEQEKVHTLYDLIGERGLYVNSNIDVFSQKPEPVSLLHGTGYKVQLLHEGSRGYASPLLFATLTSLLNHGTMLITGSPGIGKTTGAEYAGHFFTGTSLDEILSASIKGHPQLTRESMVSRYNLGKLINKGIEEPNPRKFLQCPVKILDEGNRMPSDTLSIIMDLVDRGKTTHDDYLLKATPGPLFMTANYADEGTFQFTPPFLDRFDVAVMVTSPQSYDLPKIRERGDVKLNGELEKALKIPRGLKLNFDKIRKEIKAIPEETENDFPKVSAFADFIYSSLRFSEVASKDLVRATKGNAWLRKDDDSPGHFQESPFLYSLNELSIRTVKAMERYSKAFAWFLGEEKLTTNHLKSVLPYLLWHKIEPTEKAKRENPLHENDRISFVQSLTEKIEADYTELLKNRDALNNYIVSLNVIRTGKIDTKTLNPDEIRTITRNAITTLGKIDKPYILPIVSHIASEYNEKIMCGYGR